MHMPVILCIVVVQLLFCSFRSDCGNSGWYAIHSTALRPLTARPSAHLQCVFSVCKCCAATVVMIVRVCETLCCIFIVPSLAVRFCRCHASLHCYRQQEDRLFSRRPLSRWPLIQRPLERPLIQRMLEPESSFSSFVQ